MDFLINLAIGDSYGAPFEWNTKDFIKEYNTGKNYVDRSGKTLKNSIYTDDTAMSLAVAEHMLEDLPITQVSFAKNFIRSYKRDPRGGYSKRMTNLLSTSQKPIDLLARAAPTKGNGCVMRTVPLGLMSRPETVIHAAIVQSSITHGSVEGVNSTVAIALTAHYFYHEIEDNYIEWMEKMMGQLVFQQILHAYQGGEVQCEAITTASLCIRLVLENDKMTDILFKAVDVGGDVDSTAAVSLGLASLNNNIKNDLSKTLYDNLETGTYGRDYIEMIDKKLVEKFPKNKTVKI